MNNTRQLLILCSVLLLSNMAYAQRDLTNAATTGIKVTSLSYQDDSTHLNIIAVQFTNFVYNGSSNLIPENIATNTDYYALSQSANGATNVVQVIFIKPVGNEPLIAGMKYCPQVFLEGKFAPSTNYNLSISFPGITPVQLPVSGDATNSWLYETFGPMTFNLQPYQPSSGSGALGIQYSFNVDFNQYDWFKDRESFKTNNSSFFKLNFTSQGQFGINYGSTNANSSTNNIQDSLTAELDFKYLWNWHVPEAFDHSRTDAYPVGVLVSPVGFEWNKELSLGSYTPKAAVGGSIPWADSLSLALSRWEGLTNSFTAPTLFTGVTYVSPLATNGTEAALASNVHERWDTEFIYDMPLFNWPLIHLNEVAFRTTWNSYIGIDHSLWKYYYQVGTVWYFANSGTAGVFVGYAAGEQPPAYTRTAGWQLGLSLKF